MGSKISIINDTNQDWQCCFTILGGARPAGGKKRKILIGNQWESITGTFTPSMPIMVCVQPPNQKKELKRKQITSPGAANTTKVIYVSQIQPNPYLASELQIKGLKL